MFRAWGSGFSFQVNARRSRRHTFKTMRQSRNVCESVSKRLVSQVRLCAAPGATPSERCAIGAGGTALGALASEKGGAASGAARRFKWLGLPRATPRPANIAAVLLQYSNAAT